MEGEQPQRRGPFSPQKKVLQTQDVQPKTGGALSIVKCNYNNDNHNLHKSTDYHGNTRDKNHDDNSNLNDDNFSESSSSGYNDNVPDNDNNGDYQSQIHDQRQRECLASSLSGALHRYRIPDATFCSCSPMRHRIRTRSRTRSQS